MNTNQTIGIKEELGDTFPEGTQRPTKTEIPVLSKPSLGKPWVDSQVLLVMDPTLWVTQAGVWAPGKIRGEHSEPQSDGSEGGCSTPQAVPHKAKAVELKDHLHSERGTCDGTHGIAAGLRWQPSSSPTPGPAARPPHARPHMRRHGTAPTFLITPGPTPALKALPSSAHRSGRAKT